MPGRLEKLSSDPNGKGRGAGYYYHRGNGEYSKYSEALDKRVKARGHKSGDKSLVGGGAYRHTHDKSGEDLKPKKRKTKKTTRNKAAPKKKAKKSPSKATGWGGLNADVGGRKKRKKTTKKRGTTRRKSKKK